VKQEIPELPDEKRKRFLAQYSITPEHASSLIYDPHIADYYEDVASKIDPRLSATWIADVLKGELNYRSISMREASKRIPHDEFVTILRYLGQGVITERGATEMIREMLDKGGNPEEIIKIKGLATIGLEEMEKAIGGKKAALNFLVGQVMEHTRGTADPKEVRRMLLDKIESGV
jgi:aspartyl-tRNA(Asn)/glutamyl-tRNA(Gln) amidotransferase subunit B